MSVSICPWQPPPAPQKISQPLKSTLAGPNLQNFSTLLAHDVTLFSSSSSFSKLIPDSTLLPFISSSFTEFSRPSEFLSTFLGSFNISLISFSSNKPSLTMLKSHQPSFYFVRWPISLMHSAFLCPKVIRQVEPKCCTSPLTHNSDQPRRTQIH